MQGTALVGIALWTAKLSRCEGARLSDFEVFMTQENFTFVVRLRRYVASATPAFTHC